MRGGLIVACFTFALALSAVKSAEAALTCRQWPGLSREAKLLYVDGMVDGIKSGAAMAAQEVFSDLDDEEDSLGLALANRVLDKVLPAGFRLGWIVDELDIVCRDSARPEAMRLWEAFLIASRKVGSISTGEAPRADRARRAETTTPAAMPTASPVP